MWTGLGSRARRYGWLLLILSLFASIPAVLSARRLTLEADVSHFFKADDPYLRDYHYFSEQFGVTDALVLVIRETGSDLDARVRDLVNRLEATDAFTRLTTLRPPGKSVRLVMGFPRRPATDLVAAAQTLEAIRRVLRETGIRAEITGGARETLEANEGFRRDSVLTGTAATLLILAMVLLGTGDVVSAALAMWPLGAGILWLLGITQWTLGAVNVISACLSTSLIGIGIDYALHLHHARRHVEDRPDERAWARIFHRYLPPLLVSATTTAAAFLCLVFSDIRGFTLMGWLGGLGLALIFMFSLALLPTLLDLGRRFPWRLPPAPMGWLVRAADLVTRRRGLTVLLFLAVTLPMLWLASRMEFEQDIHHYEDPRVEAFRVRARLAEELGINFNQILLATGSLKDERHVLGLVRPYVGGDRLFARVDCLSERLNLPVPDAGAPKDGDALRLFRGKDGHSLCMFLYPRENIAAGDTLQRTTDAVREIVRRAEGRVIACSGGPVMIQHLIALVRRDIQRLAVITSVVVAVIVALLVRRPRLFLSALVPLAGAVIWTLGALRLAGYRISLSNAVIIPLLLGLGIDYGVHIVYHLHHRTVHEVMQTAGAAVFWSGATTAGSFFCLCLAGNHSVAAMGYAGGIGITASLLWSLVFLPAVLGQRRGE